jgi:hypothetical protein
MKYPEEYKVNMGVPGKYGRVGHLSNNLESWDMHYLFIQIFRAGLA